MNRTYRGDWNSEYGKQRLNLPLLSNVEVRFVRKPVCRLVLRIPCVANRVNSKTERSAATDIARVTTGTDIVEIQPRAISNGYCKLALTAESGSGSDWDTMIGSRSLTIYKFSPLLHRDSQLVVPMIPN